MLKFPGHTKKGTVFYTVSTSLIWDSFPLDSAHSDSPVCLNIGPEVPGGILTVVSLYLRDVRTVEGGQGGGNYVNIR